MSDKQPTDAECVEQLRAALASLDEATQQFQDGILSWQPTRHFGSDLLRGVLREVDRMSKLLVCPNGAHKRGYTGDHRHYCDACNEMIGPDPEDVVPDDSRD